jgi:hypothetical protein
MLDNFSEKNNFEKIKKVKEEITEVAKEKTIGYILTAFGLIAGLAWNDAIKSLIEYVFPLSPNTLLLKFIYAILITLVVVLISNYLIKLTKNKK